MMKLPPIISGGTDIKDVIGIPITWTLIFATADATAAFLYAVFGPTSLGLTQLENNLHGNPKLVI